MHAAAPYLFLLAPCLAQPAVDITLLGNGPVHVPLLAGTAPELVPDGLRAGTPCFVVRERQVGLGLDTPAFVAGSTTLTWSWRKEKGTVCIVQVALRNPETGSTRYLGYGAGAWSEPPSPDPTVETFVSSELPRDWTRVERRLLADIQQALGWEGAQITGLYLSPWDGAPGSFAGVAIEAASAADPAAERRLGELEVLRSSGTGAYAPLRLRGYGDRRADRFETSFEECAPGRNAAANEWSAFGIDGDSDFNAMGRDLHVRYPVFDLLFRLAGGEGKGDGKGQGEGETAPDALESFRLGLVRDRLPAIWGAWEHEGLRYRVTVLTVPGGDLGNFDLYKLEVENTTAGPLESRLVAVVEGPPDMTLEEDGPAGSSAASAASAAGATAASPTATTATSPAGTTATSPGATTVAGPAALRGLGGAVLIVADRPAWHRLAFRDWGLCDKRAKAYAAGGGPGATEGAIATYRLGLDGVPVTYRFRAEAGKKYAVYLAATPAIDGHLVEKPRAEGDLVFEYRVEGCAARTLDAFAYAKGKRRPLGAGFDGARDLDGDGFVEVASGTAADSRLKHSRLSAIYVFPEGTELDDGEAIASGAKNARCVFHIDVGATPEQGPQNQRYDKSDIGLARLLLGYGGVVQPGGRATHWLRVPAIHRREPVSMGYIAHAFRDVLFYEVVLSFGFEKVSVLKVLDPRSAEERVARHWEAFFARAAAFDLPDPILGDMFLSRLATRAVLDVKITPGVVYNACSPFFYFDHAYRDQAYVVYALDLAGLHDRAARILGAYCTDAKDIVKKGPIAFDGKPLQLGMGDDGLWLTRPGQFDTQGQNIWALVEHYKLSGDRRWLVETAYPYVVRGAQWIVGSRRRHMAEVKDPGDPRYGLIEPGGMEVLDVGKGMHMYYMNAFAVLGLREAADAALALGRGDDHRLFARECQDLKRCLNASFARTFKRLGLYEGHLWFGVEPEGVGMYGFWAHNCLVWPCRAIDPHDPLLTATWRRLERMSGAWGGGLHSEGPGSFWPYIGADRGTSYILRGEPERALDYFCAFTDTAGSTLSWGEGYANVMAGGDQPHMWADAQWLQLFRHLFVMEDGAALMLTPATFRRWTQGERTVSVKRLPTHFGDLDLTVTPREGGKLLDYRVRLEPRGDQGERRLEKLVIYPRTAGGRPIEGVQRGGKSLESFTRDAVLVADPPRGEEIQVSILVSDGA